MYGQVIRPLITWTVSALQINALINSALQIDSESDRWLDKIGSYLRDVFFSCSDHLESQ